ncbi:hypothetical protein DSL72_001639 [Monilinia vaccinii-corymbosi]|uniref:Uncharacterized protein n=1 Tax=Monilinia vaccinii-corymbosi TaxID=61207 RepID=A0A8A3P584_9HELO|nr:hypothetical protein DSL72_001639 [Monilinia vaccinii-corymbosi]
MAANPNAADITPKKDTSGTQSSDRSANDQGYRGMRCCADKRPDLEDSNGNEVNIFDGEMTVKFAIEQLKGAQREKIGVGPPPKVLRCIKLDADDGYCSSQNGLILYQIKWLTIRKTARIYSMPCL